MSCAHAIGARGYGNRSNAPAVMRVGVRCVSPGDPVARDARNTATRRPGYGGQTGCHVDSLSGVMSGSTDR